MTGADSRPVAPTGAPPQAQTPGGAATRTADLPITALKGVGRSVAATLARLGIFSTRDLLLHLPLRYQDRSVVVPIRALAAERECLVQGEVVDCQVAYGRRRSLLATIEDGTGYLGLRFFHFSRQQQAGLRPGTRVSAFGEVRFGPSGLEMAHPEYRSFSGTPPAPEAGLTPVYPTTRGLGQNRIRALTAQLAQLNWPDAPGTPYRDLLLLHRPPPGSNRADVDAARERLAIQELTAYFLIMRHRQLERERLRTLPLPRSRQLGRQLLERLGFELTGAQRRVVREVLEDLEKPQPMLRLVQGDVGAGKTVVAAFAAIRAAEQGAQTALMAPTEILAEQHYLNFSAWLEPLGIPVVLLTGSQNAADRRAVTARIASGEALVAVGTHALFQGGVAFHRLALTIIDEQHRFGVHQRMALRSKGQLPHQLVMTATPIPRTLTMALYADMAVSVLDELPAGRQPIDTRAVADTRRDEVLAALRQAIARGEQAYWVCPLIEPSDQIEAAAAIPTAEALQKALPEASVALLHGRLSSAEKASVMAAFKNGEHQLLVATTVVEVGVDVANATLMIIENPERLGLAQLHQLRGRVGRGSAASHCVLLYHTPLGAQARSRLKVIRDSQDGFFIAEQDLALRGPGELLGTRQTGEQSFRIADLTRDAHLLDQALGAGEKLLRDDPQQAAALLQAWAPGDNGPVSV
ncbi:MAG: ATP-dependent DNA helicase RecG [Pseudomonadales bacterium]